MSLYPCEGHGRQIKGRLGAIYPTLLQGSGRRSRHIRACADCMPKILSDLSPGLIKATDEALQNAEPKCDTCGYYATSFGVLNALFVTYYMPGEERADLFARVCDACGDALTEAFALGL